MKLYYSNTSPYSRKVRMAVQFKRLENQVEQILCNPFIEKPDETHCNPLGKIPTLVLESNMTIFDSPVICEYLDTLNTHCSLYPKTVNEWLNVKRTEALGDGILDAAYNIVMENRRSDAEISKLAVSNWTLEIERSLLEVEKILLTLKDDVTQSHISIYSTLGYLDFRLPEINWRNKYSSVMPDWYNRFRQTHTFVTQTDPS